MHDACTVNKDQGFLFQVDNSSQEVIVIHLCMRFSLNMKSESFNLYEEFYSDRVRTIKNAHEFSHFTLLKEIKYKLIK